MDGWVGGCTYVCMGVGELGQLAVVVFLPPFKIGLPWLMDGGGGGSAFPDPRAS